METIIGVPFTVESEGDRVREITPMQLVEMLLLVKGAQPISFWSVTDARLNKRGNPHPMPVKKLSHVNGFVGFDYESVVNRQRVREDKEGDFESEERSWGTKLTNYLVEHKGTYYLAVKVERSLHPARYFDAEGNELTKEQVSPFFGARKDLGRQGVEKEVIYRNYTVGNIRHIRMNGVNYNIIPE